MDDGEREGSIDVEGRFHPRGQRQDDVRRRDDVSGDGLRVFDPCQEPPCAGEPVEGEERDEGGEGVQGWVRD